MFQKYLDFNFFSQSGMIYFQNEISINQKDGILEEIKSTVSIKIFSVLISFNSHSSNKKEIPDCIFFLKRF